MALSGIGILGAKRGKLIPKPVKKLRLARLKRRLRQLNPQSFAAHMVRNEIARVDGTAETMSGGNIRQYADMLQNKAKQYAGKPGVRWLIQKELALININRFRGKIAFPKIGEIGEIEGIGRRKGKGRLKLKKIFKGIKKISLAANRNAFLALVRLNLRGLALKLKRVNQTKMLRLWERLGGNKKSLLKAISKGSQKRPLLGASKKTRRIKGFEEDSIGVIFNEPISNVASQAIGTGAESTAAVSTCAPRG